MLKNETLFKTGTKYFTGKYTLIVTNTNCISTSWLL